MTAGSTVPKGIVFQVTDVHKPLMSVGAMCDAGYECLMSKEGGFVRDVESNEMEIKTRFNNANTILAINRGGCSFDVKSKNAELMGYAGLLVVNDPEDQLSCVCPRDRDLSD